MKNYTTILKNPFLYLKKIGDLCNNGGLLMSLFHNIITNELFILDWCDFQNKVKPFYHRWHYYKISLDNLNKYLNKELSCLDLKKNTTFHYLIDLDGTSEINNIWKTNIKELKELNYISNINFYFFKNDTDNRNINKINIFLQNEYRL